MLFVCVFMCVCVRQDLGDEDVINLQSAAGGAAVHGGSPLGRTASGARGSSPIMQAFNGPMGLPTPRVPAGTTRDAVEPLGPQE